ncbi:MAG: hypothetical protein ABI688_00055 [Bacteroidota bacterium]
MKDLLEVRNITKISIQDKREIDKLNPDKGFSELCTAISLLTSYWINSLNNYNQDLPEREKKIGLKRS